ncbi:MAG: hypothetical protein JW941_03455, partial [Candidatus Coatesbacteria bacterium]|nr:hypothetical protein [Candidatus Coatesbacteria bacterium]
MPEASRYWNMVDSLEKARVSASESSITPFSEAMTNNDFHIVSNKWGMKKKVTIDNEQRSSVFAPSATSIECPVRIPPHSLLDFGFAVSPDAWSRAGDGCEFEVLLKDGNTLESLFLKYINPKARKEDRRWFDAQIDLS